MGKERSRWEIILDILHAIQKEKKGQKRRPMITGISLKLNLVPIRVTDWGSEIAKTLPELPDARRQRFISVYSIKDEHAKSLTSEKKVADFYEEVAAQVDPKMAAVWTADVLKGELNYRDIGIDAFKVEDMVQLVSLLSKDKITEQSGIQVIRTILNEGGSPDTIIAAEGLLKAEGDIVTTAVEEAISENPQPIADYHNGKPEALNFVVGQVMKKTKGRADAKSVRELILQKI